MTILGLLGNVDYNTWNGLIYNLLGFIDFLLNFWGKNCSILPVSQNCIMHLRAYHLKAARLYI